MRCLFVVSCLVLVTACTDPSPIGPTVPLNERFELAPGQSAIIEGAVLQVTFQRVSGDSRCPADAVCIQGGDAIVVIEANSADGLRREYDLHTGDMRPVTHRDFTIELVQLLPYPFSSRTIQPDEYRATLRVTR